MSLCLFSSAHTFEVLSFTVNALLPTSGPLPQHAVRVLVCRYPANVVVDSIFQVIQRPESLPSHGVCQEGVEKKIVGGQVGRIRRVWHDRNPHCGQKMLSKAGSVGGGVVHMQHKSLQNPWSSCSNGQVHPMEDLDEVESVDGLTAQELAMDESPVVKEGDYEYLPCGSGVLVLDQMLRSLGDPLCRLLFGLWFIHVYPTFVHGDYSPQESGIQFLSAFPQLTQRKPQVFVSVCQHFGNHFDSFADKTKVITKNSADSGKGQSSFATEVLDCKPTVSFNQVLDSVNVPS